MEKISDSKFDDVALVRRAREIQAQRGCSYSDAFRLAEDEFPKTEKPEEARFAKTTGKRDPDAPVFVSGSIRLLSALQGEKISKGVERAEALQKQGLTCVNAWEVVRRT